MMAGPFSKRRLRRLAASPDPVSFKEYVHAQPAQSSVFWSLVVSGTKTYTQVAYEHYVKWCAKNLKALDPPTCPPREVADGGLGW